MNVHPFFWHVVEVVQMRTSVNLLTVLLTWGIAGLNPYNPGGAHLCPSAVLHGLGVGSRGARSPPIVYRDLEPENVVGPSGLLQACRLRHRQEPWGASAPHLRNSWASFLYMAPEAVRVAARAAGLDPNDEELDLSDLTDGACFSVGMRASPLSVCCNPGGN